MINIIASLRFSIKAFGPRKGLKLPIIVYGPIKMKTIGTINVHCPMRRGLIVIGSNNDTVSAPYTLFCNTGKIEIYGPLYLNFGSVLVNEGIVIFRGNNIVGNQTNINIRQRLDVGYNTIFGFENHIADHDYHFMVDVNTRQVHRNSSSITIGRFNWFGSNCFIKKGTVTPDYLTVASPCSMLAKDYSTLPAHSVLAGCPAHLVKQGIRRICNYPTENLIKNYFKQNPDAKSYQIDPNADLDDVCKLL
jgi:acetyltransferase-like isoleucine patch superfamily enzyme